MKAQAIFDAFLAREAEPEASSLEELCARHPEHERELRRLWAAYGRASDLIDRVTARERSEVDAGLERYEVRGEIARGGMGRVLEVWDTELRRILAMKVLRDESDGVGLGALDRIQFERHHSRLVNEAQILGQLEHPGIVPIHEVGRDTHGRPYFTMLRVQGRALGEIFDDVRAHRNGWTTTRAVGVLLRVCEAVAHAHSKGVIHRDLKPANVMVGPFGEVFVMDWGLAKARGCSDAADIRLRQAAFSMGKSAAGAEAPGPHSVHTDRRDATESDPSSPLLTMDGDVVGTPSYMSPEQAQGRVDDVDERSDVYSVGAMLYHLLSSFHPFCEYDRASSGDPPHFEHREVLARVQGVPPTPVQRLAPEASVELVAICEKAMARDSSRRFASMLALSEDLRAHLEGRVVKAHRSGALVEMKKWVARHRVLVWLMSLVMVTLAGSALGFGLLYRDAERARQTAERRLELLRQSVGGPRLRLDGIPSAASFHDDFEDGQLASRLRIWSHPELVEERDGRLVLHRSGPSSAETFLGLDPSLEVIRGDFDLTVSFDTEGFSIPPVGERTLGVNVRTAMDRRLVAMIHRLNPVRDPAARGSREVYEAMTVDGSPIVSVPTTDRAGRFRIVRTGVRVSAYFWSNGWQEIVSDDVTSEPLSFGLYCFATLGDDGTYSVAFDDLRLETFATGPSRSLAPFVETFDEGLSSYFRIAGGATGIAGVVDGQAVLEKFSGGQTDVYARLELDWPRCVLRGDLDVSLDYELEEFPLPRETGLSFALSLLNALDYSEYIALIGRNRSPTEEWTDSFAASTSLWLDAERVPASGASGKLRIRRKGSRLSLYYWDEGWRTLLEREGSEADAFLRINLAGSPEAAVVTIDNLRVEGLVASNAHSARPNAKAVVNQDHYSVASTVAKSRHLSAKATSKSRTAKSNSITWPKHGISHRGIYSPPAKTSRRP